MNCPKCGREDATHATDSRWVSGTTHRYGPHRRRRRVCGHCGHRFTTREFVDGALPSVFLRRLHDKAAKAARDAIDGVLGISEDAA